MTEPRTIGGVLGALARHPWEMLGRRWNYKSATLSALIRAGLFFATNLAAGLEAAIAAATTEVVFRLATAGFYGALTQAFRHVEPRSAATVTVMVLLPLVAHTLELAVHAVRGTPALAASISVSVVFTAVSTAFNLFAMRQGVLIVGKGRRSLIEDLCAMPRLFALFFTTVVRSCVRACL